MHQRHSILLKTLCVLGWLHIIRRYTKTLKGFKRIRTAATNYSKKVSATIWKRKMSSCFVWVFWCGARMRIPLDCIAWKNVHVEVNLVPNYVDLCTVDFGQRRFLVGGRVKLPICRRAFIWQHRSVCTIFPQKCVGKNRAMCRPLLSTTRRIVPVL